jgi:hypothetical protein
VKGVTDELCLLDDDTDDDCDDDDNDDDVPVESIAGDDGSIALS